ncbi:hypothetical protein FHETE_7110 [Fusarium heterosporum]|uniref:Uncharacterized protein n=1 Tax=Fusarium heterosporum TaxID=42747 RepID=A0A8H5WN99_FUSHE|nr:hypothetical protein FHETE_7110 [Fusarium heterosporum]
MSSSPPPPPPPPPPSSYRTIPFSSRPVPPIVTGDVFTGGLLLELLVYNGAPFNDHWAYFIQSDFNSDVGVYIDAQGDVRNGFKLQIKRGHNITEETPRPSVRIPLQWVESQFLNKTAMFDTQNNTSVDTMLVCDFERSVFMVPAPTKTLNTVARSVS